MQIFFTISYLDYGMFTISLSLHYVAGMLCFSIYDVEECARVLHCSMSASPSEKLLRKWSQNGMTVEILAKLLDKLHLEKSLVFLRNRGKSISQIVHNLKF